MKEFELKYVCNPNQKPASIICRTVPICHYNCQRQTGYINSLMHSHWQLVKELKAATGMPVLPPLSIQPTLRHWPETERGSQARCFVDDIEGLDDSPLPGPMREPRYRRMSSFGDWIALSDVCDVTTATIIKREVSDASLHRLYPEAWNCSSPRRRAI